MALKDMSLRGTGVLTDHGKRAIARAMYIDGQQFIAAGMLLDRENRQRNASLGNAVVRHLICQGIEVTLKSLLLASDYDEYRPLLRRRFGHKLSKLVSEASKIAGLNVSPALSRELNVLSTLYEQHVLRYATGIRIFVDMGTVPYKRVLKRVYALMKVVDRRQLI